MLEADTDADSDAGQKKNFFVKVDPDPDGWTDEWADGRMEKRTDG